VSVARMRRPRPVIPQADPPPHRDGRQHDGRAGSVIGMHTSSGPALRAADLGRRYGRRWALRGVDFEIPPGRTVALIGANGAGKTTLLHLAVGLLEPSVGAIEILGRRPPAALSDIGFVAQDKPLYRRFSVADLLVLGRRLNVRWDPTYASRRLDALGIAPGRQIRHLSGGQRAQVALTLALAKRPRLLLLDEPVGNLDPLARREFLGTVADEARQTGMTVVHSSHDVAELDRACDFLVAIRGARVAFAQPVDGQPLADLILDTLRSTEVAS
jgi:ABC-2 type transport system ATP-binding protein